MCLAIPMQVISIDRQSAKVSSSGVAITVSLDLVDHAVPGDYVIVHAGFAIQVLSDEEAKETLAILKRLEMSWENQN